MDDGWLLRQWMVQPNEEYNITFFQSPPKNHRFFYMNDRPQCIRIALRLSQPFRLEVYVEGKKLEENDYDTARAFDPPRKPILGTDPHGAYTFDPHERTFFFIQCGGGTGNGLPPTLGGGIIKLELIQVVQLSMTVSVKAEEFDQDAQSTFIDNVALLLQIPSYRIKIVGVQNIGARRLKEDIPEVDSVNAKPAIEGEARKLDGNRRLQDGGTQIILQILAPPASNSTNSSNDTGNGTGNGTGNSIGGFDPAALAALEEIAAIIQDLADTGAIDDMCSASGFSCIVETIEVSDPELETPTAAPTLAPTADGGYDQVAPPTPTPPTAAPTSEPTNFTVTSVTSAQLEEAPTSSDLDDDTKEKILIGVVVGSVMGSLGMVAGILLHRQISGDHRALFGGGTYLVKPTECGDELNQDSPA
jgi:hypothetical protein